jgi:hypothetical protein
MRIWAFEAEAELLNCGQQRLGQAISNRPWNRLHQTCFSAPGWIQLQRNSQYKLSTIPKVTISQSLSGVGRYDLFY